MKTYLFGVLILIFFTGYACQNGASSIKDTIYSDSLSQPMPILPDTVAPVFLRALQASSNTPGKEVEYILDNTKDSYWQPAEGMGPDEGISIHFLNYQQVFVSSIEIKEVAPTQIKTVRIYVNDRPFITSPLNVAIPINALVTSLFIRILDVNKQGIIQSRIRDKNLRIETYNSEQPLRIKQVNLYNQDGQLYKLVPPQKVVAKVNPSSNLNPVLCFHAGYLFDGNPSLAWIGNKKDFADLDRIELQFNQVLDLTHIQIWNGHQLSPEHYQGSARVKTFQFGIEDSSEDIYQLKDQEGGQKVALQGQNLSTTFFLDIVDAYPGLIGQETAISEILLFEQEQPLAVLTNFESVFQNEIQNEVTGSILKMITNRWYFNEVEQGDTLIQKSIVLRENGQCDFYSRVYSSFGEEIVDAHAIAHWLVLEKGISMAKINLKGTMVYHQSGEEEENTYIKLEETISVLPGLLKGEKDIGEFYIIETK